MGKHIPHRTCVSCREVLPKRNLIRVVKTPDGIKIDSTGKLSGRGAYIHDRKSCWEKAVKGPLAHALKTELSDVDREVLLTYMASLAPEESQTVS